MPDRYRPTETIYQSPNGEICCAEDGETGLTVILKCFPARQQQLYLREMAAAFGISHPNINRCLDTFYQDDGRPCMVYEYIAGGNLRGWLEQHGALDDDTVLSCLRDVLEALQHLHGLGMIHCDIKPENVLVRLDDAGHPASFVLADLGAAAPLREARESHHTTASPAYVAPERLYDKFSFSSDLYSLGIMGFELLTGHRPFEGGASTLARAHLGKRPAIGEIAQPDWRDFIERLLEKEPLARIGVDSALEILQGWETGLERTVAHDARLPNKKVTQVRASALEKSLPLAELSRWRVVAAFEPHHQPENLWVFNRGGVPLLGLHYSGHTEFLSLPAGQSWQRLIGTGALKSLGSQRLAYATQSRIFSLDLASKQRVLLKESCEDIVHFDLSGDYLVWCNETSTHLCDLRNGGETVCRLTHYLMRPQLCLLPNGHFFASEGYMNHEVLLRDLKGEACQRWTLDGPVLAFSGQNQSGLALVLSMTQSGRHTLWHLNQDGSAHSFSPNGELSAYCCMLGQFFWATRDGEVYRCGLALLPQLVGQLPDSPTLFHFSTDYRFLAAATGQGVTLWENPVAD